MANPLEFDILTPHKNIQLSRNSFAERFGKKHTEVLKFST